MIDPTGRTALLTNRKLARLAVLLAGVFVVGCGIGWLVSQLGGSPVDTGSQRAATTLPVPVPSSPAPAQPEEAVSPPTAADALPAPSAPPSATAQVLPASAPEPAPPLVVIEPAPSPVSPPPTAPPPTAPPPQAAPAAPSAATPSAPVRHAHHKHAARAKHGGHHHRHHESARTGTVTVIGAKAAAPGTRWIVQLGAFRTNDHAVLLAMTLKAHGTSALVTKSDRGAKGIWYVVRAEGTLPLKSAVATAHRIATREGIATYVVRMGN